MGDWERDRQRKAAGLFDFFFFAQLFFTHKEQSEIQQDFKQNYCFKIPVSLAYDGLTVHLVIGAEKGSINNVN